MAFMKNEDFVRNKLMTLFRAISSENCFGSIEKIVNHLMSNGITANRWISAKNHLPEELSKDNIEWSEDIRPSIDVLVKIRGSKTLQTGWYSYRHNAWCDLLDKDISNDVTHWMYLPDLPDEEDGIEKEVWLRAGVSVKLTKDQLKAIEQQTDYGRQLLKEMLESGAFRLDGETYAPANATKKVDKNKQWVVCNTAEFNY